MCFLIWFQKDKYVLLCRHDDDEVVTKTVGASWFDGFADAQLLWVASKIRYISLRVLVQNNLDLDLYEYGSWSEFRFRLVEI